MLQTKQVFHVPGWQIEYQREPTLQKWMSTKERESKKERESEKVSVSVVSSSCYMLLCLSEMKEAMGIECVCVCVLGFLIGWWH